MNKKEIIFAIKNGPKNGIIFRQLKKDTTLCTEVYEYTSHLPSNIVFSTRLYHWLYSIKDIPNCPICSKPLKFNSHLLGYQKVCSFKCKCEFERTIGKDLLNEKRKQTSLSKYGTEFPWHLQEIKEKKVQNCIDKYGVEHPTQLQHIKDKRKQTMIDRFGVEYASQNEDVIKKREETCIERFGTKSPLESEIIKNKIKDTCIEKYGVDTYRSSDDFKQKVKQTCLKKYGTEYVTQSVIIKTRTIETNLKKYGVSYPQQTQTIKDKVRLNGYKSKYKYKTYILPSGKKIKTQGYGDRFLNWYFLNGGKEENLKVEHECDIFKYKLNETIHDYCPDFQLISSNEIIEVKSSWTLNVNFEKNISKFNAVVDSGKTLKIYVFDDEKCPLIIDYDKTLTKDNLSVKSKS